MRGYKEGEGLWDIPLRHGCAVPPPPRPARRPSRHPPPSRLRRATSPVGDGGGWKKPPPGWEGGRRNACRHVSCKGCVSTASPVELLYRRSPLVQSQSVTGSPPSWQGLSQPSRVDWPAAGFLLPGPSLGAHRPVCQGCWSPVVAVPGGCRPWFSRLGPRGGAAMVPLCIYRRGVQVGCGGCGIFGGAWGGEGEVRKGVEVMQRTQRGEVGSRIRGWGMGNGGEEEADWKSAPRGEGEGGWYDRG